jgi:hypothetical protein
MGAAAPVITTVAAVAVAVVAPEVIPAIGTLITTGDTALAGAMLADSSVASFATTEAMVAGGAALGGTTGAITAAAQDKSVGEGALRGAGTGAVVAGVGQALPSDLPGGVSGATKGAAGGFTGAQLAGQNLQQSTKQAEIGGVTGGITGTISDLSGGDSTTRGVLAAAGPYIRQDVSNLFGGTSSTTPSGTSSSSQALPSYIASGGTTGSALLGSQIGGGGTDISPPVQVGSEPTTSRNVWNQASLRSSDQGGNA